MTLSAKIGRASIDGTGKWTGPSSVGESASGSLEGNFGEKRRVMAVRRKSAFLNR